MRLIDANEIAEELYGLRQETKCTNEPFLAGKSDAYWDAHGMVIEARTIDAIPVEWIKAQIENEKRAPLFRRYADALLIIWQQEQEAHGTLDIKPKVNNNDR